MTGITRLLANGKEILAFLKDFTTGAIGNSSITWINTDDTTTTYTFPNIAKFTNDVKVSIRVEMYDYMYIDAVNGDDNNDGLTTATKKKTIASAVASMPVGSVRVIYLEDGQTYTVPTRVDLSGKSIYARTLDTPNMNPKIQFENGGGFDVKNGADGGFSSRYMDYVTSDSGQAISGGTSAFTATFGKLTFIAVDGKIKLNDSLFIYAYDSYGLTEIGLSRVTIEKKNTTTNAKLVYSQSLVNLSVASLIYGNNVTDKNDVYLGVNTDLTNFKTNRTLV